MDPWKPLVRLGWVAAALGALDLARFWRPYETILLDLPSACASLVAGCALLRRRPSAFVATATAAGIIVADALVSIVLIGPLFWRDLERHSGFWPDPVYEFGGEELAIAVSRLLLYAFQLIFWPYAASRVMKDQRTAGIPRAYAFHTRDTVVGAFLICGWISLVVQLVAKIVVFDLV